MCEDVKKFLNNKNIVFMRNNLIHVVFQYVFQWPLTQHFPWAQDDIVYGLWIQGVLVKSDMSVIIGEVWTLYEYLHSRDHNKEARKTTYKTACVGTKFFSGTTIRNAADCLEP